MIATTTQVEKLQYSVQLFDKQPFMSWSPTSIAERCRLLVYAIGQHVGHVYRGSTQSGYGTRARGDRRERCQEWIVLLAEFEGLVMLFSMRQPVAVYKMGKMRLARLLHELRDQIAREEAAMAGGATTEQAAVSVGGTCAWGTYS